MTKRNLFPFLLLLLCCLSPAVGQRVAVKTDLLQWATTTPNIGAELTLGPQLTLALSWAYNPWTFADNRKLRHWSVQPELRYWLREPFNGHALGLHAAYTEFNAGGINLPLGILSDLGNYRYEGKQYGGSLTYAYQWMLAPRWGIEASLGVGYLYSRYHQYQCRTCGLPVDPDGAPQGESPLQTKHYFGPTKAAVSLIFIIH